MNPHILHTDVQEFILKSEGTDIYRLVLQQSPFPGVSSRELAEQIVSRTKAADKLPTWYSAPAIYYPNKRNLEQSSSEATAAYKASLVQVHTIFDLTGGFGVDTYFFSKTAGMVVYWEADEDLAEIAAHNLKRLGALNVSCHHGDGLAWLNEKKQLADLIYLDPSRRGRDRKRVFLLSECQPDVPAQLPVLLGAAPLILVKTSPLLDLQAGLRELQYVREIHIVAVANEVKEVLWLLEKGFVGEPVVYTINLLPAGEQKFSFNLSQEKPNSGNYSEPLSYLYEPNAAIMKSGGFHSLGKALGLPRLHLHSHLYTSAELVDFPGRAFRIRRTEHFSRNVMKTLADSKANISTRNFPLTVAVIRNKFRIAEGGLLYLFFTKSYGKGLILIECEKI